MRSVLCARYPRNTSLAERCEYSSRKWCSVDPHVLEAGGVGGLHQLELVHERVVLGLGVHVLAELRRVPLDEDPEFHHVPPDVRFGSDTVSDPAGACEFRAALRFCGAPRRLDDPRAVARRRRPRVRGARACGTRRSSRSRGGPGSATGPRCATTSGPAKHVLCAVLERHVEFLAQREGELLRRRSRHPDDDVGAVVEAIVRPAAELAASGWRGRACLLIVAELAGEDPARFSPELESVLARTGGNEVYALLGRPDALGPARDPRRALQPHHVVHPPGGGRPRPGPGAAPAPCPARSSTTRPSSRTSSRWWRRGGLGLVPPS